MKSRLHGYNLYYTLIYLIKVALKKINQIIKKHPRFSHYSVPKDEKAGKFPIRFIEIELPIDVNNKKNVLQS